MEKTVDTEELVFMWVRIDSDLDTIAFRADVSISELVIGYVEQFNDLYWKNIASWGF